MIIPILFSGCTSTVSKNEQWEYKREVINITNGKHLLQLVTIEKAGLEDMVRQYHAKVNDLGKQGWELVSIDGGDVHVFKRKL